MKIKMNNKYLQIFLVSITLVGLILFTVKYFPLKINQTTKIVNLKILDYIPSNSEFSLISSLKDYEINNFIKENLNKQDKQKMDLLMKSTFSYLGFDIREKLEKIYDGEFYLSINKSKENKKDILLIFKIKEKKGINDLLNIKDKLEESNGILKINRDGKLAFLSYITKTSDNYIICSSDKELINSSLTINNNKEFEPGRDSIIQLKDVINNKKLFLLAKHDYIENLSESNNFINNQNYITFFNFQNRNLYLDSYSLNNINIEFNEENNNLFTGNNKEEKFTLSNRFEQYNDLLLSNIDETQKYIINGIINQIKENILLMNQENNWIIGFKKFEDNNIIFENINILNKYTKNSTENNDIKYTVYSKNILNSNNNELEYYNEKPVFTYESPDLFLISNNLKLLSKDSNYKIIIEKYLNRLNINNKQIYKEILLINNTSNITLIEKIPLIKYINFYTNSELNLTFNNIYSNIEQNIPELNPKINFRTSLNIFN